MHACAVHTQHDIAVGFVWYVSWSGVTVSCRHWYCIVMAWPIIKQLMLEAGLRHITPNSMQASYIHMHRKLLLATIFLYVRTIQARDIVTVEH